MQLLNFQWNKPFSDPCYLFRFIKYRGDLAYNYSGFNLPNGSNFDDYPGRPSPARSAERLGYSRLNLPGNRSKKWNKLVNTLFLLGGTITWSALLAAVLSVECLISTPLCYFLTYQVAAAQPCHPPCLSLCHHHQRRRLLGTKSS